MDCLRLTFTGVSETVPIACYYLRPLLERPLLLPPELLLLLLLLPKDPLEDELRLGVLYVELRVVPELLDGVE